MSLLIEWVTQIIIFVLLATIVDLLIPNHSMKKYVKLAVGLIMILIFLKPVFYIFQVDMPATLQASYLELYQEGDRTDDIENLIKIQKKEIQASQDAYILEQMVIQLTEYAKGPLQEQHQVEITDIHFQFLDNEISFENLMDMTVYIRHVDANHTNIKEIDEVIIDTGRELVTEDDDLDDIITLLRDVWELEDKVMIVTWEGGSR